ncbi:hypothetical protein ABH917_001920 [Thermobifida halotolerans]|uniref:hypothetical protein n=1 Tax=Thermobifida halotolerans TaxID=483545 RepID=UPI00351923C5
MRVIPICDSSDRREISPRASGPVTRRLMRSSRGSAALASISLSSRPNSPASAALTSSAVLERLPETAVTRRKNSRSSVGMPSSRQITVVETRLA